LSADPDELLAGILTAIKPPDRAKRVFDALQYVFGIAESLLQRSGAASSFWLDRSMVPSIAE
jgi:hypothetical protein